MKRILLLLFLCIVFFGCARKNITPHDTLVIAIPSEPANLDPRFALDADSQRIDQLIFDSLVMIDHQLNIVPHLAKSFENPNPLLYRFLLHEGVKFHDGSPLTAQDIAATLNQIRDPDFGSPLIASFKNIDEVKVVDPHILEIKLKTPQPNFLTDLTLIKAIPHKKEAKLKDKFKDYLIGSGPYQFVKKNNLQIVLKVNPNHFKYKIGPSMLQLNRIVFKVIKDDHTRLLKLKTGEIDLVQNALSSDSVAQLASAPSLTLNKSPGLTYSYLGFNLKDPILKNKKVRQAIAYGIERGEIIHHLLRDLAAPAKSVLSPLNSYHEESVKTYDYEPQKAKYLLATSGLRLPIKLEYKTSTDTEAINIARLIADQLKKIGIDITIRSYEWGTFFNDIQQGNFQMFSSRWVGVTDPDIYYDLFHSSNIPPGKNRGYYSNSNVDKWLDRSKMTTDFNERKKLFSQIQKQIAEDLPYVSLWHWNNVAVYSSRLRAYYAHPQANYWPALWISKWSPYVGSDINAR